MTKIINLFIAYLKNRNLSERTLQEYSSDLKHLISWHESHYLDGHDKKKPFCFSQINKLELAEYIENMTRIDELKPTTINRRISALKLFFDWAYHNGYSKRNPAKHIKLIKLEKSNPRFITDDEEKSFLETVRAHGTIRDRAIVTLMVHTGLRVSETCNIKKSDIHLSDKNSYIEVSANNQHRKIPLNSITQSILGRYISSFHFDSEYLFVSGKTNNKLTDRALRHIIKKYMDLAGLEGLSAYSLRHNFAYRKIQTLSIKKLAKIMGHNNITTTSSYLKTSQE
ncbi:MAG: tyrosine-type recombinase/integrase [Vulcanibacillus sp.]